MGKFISLIDTNDNLRGKVLGVNLAISISEQTNAKVLLMDLSFSGNKTIEYLLDFDPKKTILDLLKISDKLDGSIINGYINNHSSGVAFLEGIDSSQKKYVVRKDLHNILGTISTAYEYIVLLLPDSHDDVLAELVDVSNAVVLSLYPHLVSMEKAKTFLSWTQEWHFPIKKCQGLLNVQKSKNEIEKEKIEDYLGINIQSEIEYNQNQIELPLSKTSQDVKIKKYSKQVLNSISEEKSFDFKPGISKGENKLSIDYNAIKEDIHRKLIERMSESKINLNELSDTKKNSDIYDKVRKTIQELVSKNDDIKSKEERKILVDEMVNEALGLGCLEKQLKDASVTEIMVNGPDDIFVEKNGKIYKIDEKFVSKEQLLTIIDRIVSPIGRRIDESSPIVDARLMDGSRVNAVIPPLSLTGPTLTIRKFSQKKLTVEDLINFGALTPKIAKFIEVCIKMRKNTIISGGTGSGKTTLLNVLSSFIPSDERIVTIEDSAELKLPQEHVVRLESRPPSIEGKGEIPIRRLVINALRMRPDRIVVGECRGGETLDMLQAMNTGHDGSLTTIHANSPKDGISRITTMVIMAGTELPEKAIRDQIVSAVNIIVQLSRFSDGSRKITEIAEIREGKNDQIEIVPIIEYEQTGIKDGKVVGKYVATGNTPLFIKEAKQKGIQVDKSIFKQGELV
ncbi:ATPase, T2SS/T4P/T4SS family [Elusimicrobiota bacterium]